MGPSLMIDYLKSNILEFIPEFKKNSYWGELFSCDYIDSLPSFDLLFGGHWF